MAPPRKSEEQRAAERSVTRTYRAAVRIGEDFITLEETITLPIDATDDEVAQAVDLGWRVYHAQRAAVEQQVLGVRESAGPQQPFTVRDPDAPASEKQRNYVAALQEDLAWSAEQLTLYAREQSVDLVTMTKGQASTFIDGLKKLAEERPSYGDAGRGQPAHANGQAARGPAETGPVSERQLSALDRLARQHGLLLDAEVQRRFAIAPQELSAAQASALLRELQIRPARRAAGE